MYAENVKMIGGEGEEEGGEGGAHLKVRILTPYPLLLPLITPKILIKV